MGKVTIILLFFIIGSVQLFAQKVNYSPEYFGPNANPVPQFSDATIPLKTTINLSYDYYTGFGDNTGNFLLSAEIPLLSNRISLKIWNTFFERYLVSESVFDYRQMEDQLTGKANGDIYIQSRMRLAKERKYIPSIILNSTLKTASGTNFKNRRYFDTPGYYFDVEIGKSLKINSQLLSEVRGVVNAGFMCWETTGSTQNDAPMYGGKIILRNSFLDIENTLSGYYGWMNNGDAPLVYSLKTKIKRQNFNFVMQYQYGIQDYPYHHFQLGIEFSLLSLTPRYIKTYIPNQ